MSAEHHEAVGPDLHAECYACPVGSFFVGLQSATAPGIATQPGVADTFDRFLAVSHDLLDVARSAIDVADAALAEQRSARSARAERPSRVRRIDIA